MSTATTTSSGVSAAAPGSLFPEGMTPEDEPLFAAAAAEAEEASGYASLNPETPDFATEEPAEGFRHIADDGTETFLLLDPRTGEVVGEPDAPEETSDARDIAQWIGPRLRAAEARRAGIEAEKAARLAQVAAHYDRQLKREETAILRYKTRYQDALCRFAEALGLKDPDAKKRSVKLGLLTIGFRKRPGRIDVVDEATAVAWAKIACPGAIKEEILKSRIPSDMALPTEASGMVRVPPVDVFEVR